MGDLATLPTFQPSPTAYTHTDFNAVFQALTLAPGAVTTNKLGDGAVTLQKLQGIAQRQLFTRLTAGSGAPELLTLGAEVFAFMQAADAAAARTALELGDSATKAVGTTAGKVAAGDDARFSDSRKCNNSFDDPATARTALGVTHSAIEMTAVNVNQTGTGPGTGLVFNTPGAPTLTLTAGKWLVMGTVSLRMSDTAGPAGLRFCDNAGANFFGAGSAPNLETTLGQATVLGYKQVVSGTFDVFFYGIPAAGRTLNFGESSGVAYAGYLLALKLEAA